MDSPVDSPVSDTDSNKSFSNYENPNFRKLYATLSVTTMMGCDPQDVPVANDPETDRSYPDIANLRLESRGRRRNRDTSELPEGWERHEDDNGPYYWHIPR